MGTNATRLRAAGPFWLLVLAVGCGSGPDPDPRAIAAVLQRSPDRPDPDAPRLVAAAMWPEAAGASPAPAGEVGLRQATAAPREVTIVVGHHAVPVFDAELARAFFAELSGVRGEPVSCSDRDAVELVQVGRADFAVVGGRLSSRDLEAGLRETRLGVELFQLVVAPAAPVRTLSPHQVRRIFTGEVHAWEQLGLPGGAIHAVVPSESGLAGRVAGVLIPGDRFAEGCLPVPGERHVVDQLLQHPNGIGIVRLDGRAREAGQRGVAIDGNDATVEAFDYGVYPYGVPVTLVTSGPPRGLAADFLAFARSEAGRRLLARTLQPQP